MSTQPHNELSAIRPAMGLIVTHGVPVLSAAIASHAFADNSEVAGSILFVTLIMQTLAGGVDVDETARHERRFAFVAGSAFGKALTLTSMFGALLLLLVDPGEVAMIVWRFAAIFVPAMVVGSLFSVWLALQPGFREMPRPTAIVGVTEASLRFAKTLEEDPFVSARFVGFLEDRERARLPRHGNTTICGSIRGMRSTIDALGITEVFIALPTGSEQRMGEIMESLLDSAASVHFLPDFVAFRPIHETVTWVKGIPVYTVIGRPDVGASGAGKRAFDIVCASLGLLLLSPLLLLVALLIKLESPGPVLFRQIRHGADGQPFPIYKFRSMTTSACASSEIVQATKNDVRVTRLGKFLRRSSIDELPQLFNVLRGEMSLVGPRPHAAQHNEQYRRQIRGYMLRHKVRPGLTGWAQVHGLRGETETVEKMANRVRFDLDYLRHWSVGLDLYIVLRTFRQLAKGV